MEVSYIKLRQTDSTNSYLLELAKKGRGDDCDVLVAVADYQTAGKGCGTNSWESEEGKNLLFSILVHPKDIPVRYQYLLSMTEALALNDAMKAIVSDSESISIKWPNDIYYKDKKISGTLINLNVGSAGIKDLVIGSGVNVNQRQFFSDAPNPVSLCNILGKEYPRECLLEDIIERFVYYYTLLLNKGQSEIVRLYNENLYRRNGFYRYKDRNGEFEAEIKEVQPDGIIILQRRDGSLCKYEFKEISFIITKHNGKI